MTPARDRGDGPVQPNNYLSTWHACELARGRSLDAPSHGWRLGVTKGLEQMRTLGAILLVGLLVLSTAPIVMAGETSPGNVPSMMPADGLDGLGGGFIENLGQFPDEGVRYYAQWGGGGVAFLDGAVAIAIEGTASHPVPLSPKDIMHALMDGTPLHQADDVSGCVVRLGFDGAREVRPVAREAMPGVRNYLLGDDPAGWATGVRAYSEVAYEGLWEGIDLVYRSVDGRLKYEFVVAPGADPADIRVRVDGADSVAVGAGGELRLGTPLGPIIDSGLVAFHEGSMGDAVGCGFRQLGRSGYGFEVLGRDPARALVIDPVVYCSYLGDADVDEVTSICLDASGRLYACGFTGSPGFPTSAGAFQRTLSGPDDGFVARFSADRTALEVSTLIGGDGEEVTVGLFVDGAGDIYLCGATTSSDFPTTAGSLQTENMGGDYDAFLCKLDSKAQSLIYSTYLGGGDLDIVFGIVPDGTGAARFAGFSGSSDLPTTSGCFQSNLTGMYNIVAGKLDARGASLTFLTYIGGTSLDVAMQMAVDSAGCIYIAGGTSSDDYPTTTGAYSEVKTGFVDVFVTKLKADGSGLTYSTFIGGTDQQMAQCIALDDTNRAVLAGYAMSTDFPTTAGAYQSSLTGSDDAFVCVLSANGRSLAASTYLGGTTDDTANDVAVDLSGKVLVTGYTDSTDFPTTADVAIAGGYDSFVAKLPADLKQLLYSQYLGGSGDDTATTVLADGNDYTYVGGYTWSDDLATTADAYQRAFGGGDEDGFVWRLLFDLVPPVAVAGDDVTIDQHQTVELNGSRSSDNLGIVNHTWTFRYNGSDVSLFAEVAGFRFDEAGRYAVTLTVRDVGGFTATDELNVTVRDITPPFASAGSDTTVDQHMWVLFDSSRSKDNVGIESYEWTFVYDGVQQVLRFASTSFLFDIAGTYNVTLNVTDDAGLWATDTARVNVIDITGPTAEAGPSINIDQHKEGAFDGTGSTDNVGVVNWTWAFTYLGEPVTLYGPTPAFRFDAAGRYAVTLTVRDERGLTSTDSTTVIVTDVDPPMAVAGEDVVVDQGETVALDGRASTDNVGIAEATWTLVITGSDRTLTGLLSEFTFVDAGTYAVTLTVRDSMGNEATDALTVTVRDVEPPVALAGGDLHIDQHQTVGLDARGSGDNVGIVLWTWTLTYRGAPVTLEGQTVSQLFDDAGTYTVNLTVADAAGNIATDSLTVTVKDTTAPVADAGDDRTANQTQEVALDGSASTDNVGVVEWEWTFMDGGTPIKLRGERQRYTFALPGYYNVTLRVKDAEGNSDAAVLQVRVSDIMDPVAVAPGHVTVKAGDRATLDGSGSLDNVGVVSWVWTFSDGGRDVTMEGPSVSYAFKDEGDHLVTLTVTDAEGNTATDSFTVTVEADLLPMLLLLVVVAVIVVLAVVAMVVMRRRKGPAA